MEILLVHHRLPWPLDNGMDKLRYNLIRTLSTDYELTLIVPEYRDQLSEGITEVKKYVKELIIIPIKNPRTNYTFFYIKRLINLLFFIRPYYISDCYSKTFHNKLRRFLNQTHFKTIHFLSDFSANYVFNIPFDKKRIIGPMDDYAHTLFEMYQDEISFYRKVIIKCNLIVCKVYFKRIIEQTNFIFFHSSDDMQRVKNRVSYSLLSEILPVATELDDDFQPYNSEEENTIVFVGGMGASFNIDAVLFFVHDIFPYIIKEIPEVKFFIVGHNPPMQIQLLDDGKNIFVTGPVDEVIPYIQRAQVYVSSIRKGTGIKTKTIEALKVGKAIVSTNKGIQGLWELNYSAIKIVDDPKGFANAVVEILKNDKLRTEMEKNSRKLYADFYSFNKVRPVTLTIYKKAIL